MHLDKSMHCDIMPTKGDFFMQRIDDNTKVPLSRIYLLREPISRNARGQFRFAVMVSAGERVLFLHNKKTYPREWAAACIPDQDRFVCEYYLDEENYNAVVSQKLSHFMECDEVENKEIYENCAYLPELRTRLKTFQNMKESLASLKGRDAVSVQELLNFERQLICLQKHGKVAERQNHDIFFANTKKLKENSK